MTVPPRSDVGHTTMRVLAYILLVVLIGLLASAVVLLRSTAPDTGLRQVACILVSVSVLGLVNHVLQYFAGAQWRERLRVPQLILAVLVLVATAIMAIQAR